MEITTLVGGEVENMGIPHYFELKGSTDKKRHFLCHDLTMFTSQKDKDQ